jgi:hypothetical protein
MEFYFDSPYTLSWCSALDTGENSPSITKINDPDAPITDRRGTYKKLKVP